MKTATIALLFTLVSNSIAVAEELPPWLNVHGEINFDVLGSSQSNFEQNLRVQDAELKFEILVREGIKLVVKAEIEEQLKGTPFAHKWNVGSLLQEAYIEIETDKISGLPKALIKFGKHQVAFGQDFTEIPMSDDTLLADLLTKDEVVGLTVELPASFFQIVDKVAFSIFESVPGDLIISNKKGFSFQLSKEITSQLSAEISGLIQAQEESPLVEKRGSIGFVFQSQSGQWKVWSEGIITVDNSALQGSNLGAQVGGSANVGPGAIVLQYEFLQKNAHEIAVAYNLPIGSYLVLSPEIRYRKDLGPEMQDETVIGIRARIEAEKSIRHNLLKGSKKK